MTNHPNRRRGTGSNPTPEQIKALRGQLGLSQSQAAALIHATLRVWQAWEAGERRMHPAFWELFRIKAIPGG